MTYYRNTLNGNVLYETEVGEVYKVGVWEEDFPDNRMNTVSGTADRVDNDPDYDYSLDMDEIQEIDRSEVHSVVIDSLRRHVDDFKY